MTGPEHFAEAERLLAASHTSGSDDARHVIARAQVHATLAQTAAIITQTRDLAESAELNVDDWLEALNADNT